MKKFYEGASIATAIFFILTVGLTFFFKKEAHRKQVRDRNKTEKIIEKSKKDLKEHYDKENKEIISKSLQEIAEKDEEVKAWQNYFHELARWEKSGKKATDLAPPFPLKGDK